MGDSIKISFQNKRQSLLSLERGATLAEFTLMVCLVAMVALPALFSSGKLTSDSFTVAGAALFYSGGGTEKAALPKKGDDNIIMDPSVLCHTQGCRDKVLEIYLANLELPPAPPPPD